MEEICTFENSPIKLPDDCLSLNKPVPEEFGDGAIGFGIITSNAKGLLFGMFVSEKRAMPFDDNQKIIDILHEGKDEKSGLIEVNNGKTAAGKEYVYHIRKHTFNEDASIPGVRYFLNLNIRLDEGIYFLNGDFTEEGMTGMRDAMVYALLRNENVIDEGLKGWSRDPYDEEYKTGFLMNLSEQERFDSMFPAHPLSVVRKLVREIVDLN